MHAILFGIKRVHLEVVRLTQSMICESLLTPARFDMLRIVEPCPRGVFQGTLQWLLGVSAPTVSRMLKALEKRGLVRRTRDTRDGRRLIVQLTPMGRAAVRYACEMTVANQEAERTVARGVTGNTRLEADSYRELLNTIRGARKRVTQLDGTLSNMRRAFCDRAPYRHPWRLGDYVPLAPIHSIDNVPDTGNAANDDATYDDSRDDDASYGGGGAA